jgi:hypothetical protein
MATLPVQLRAHLLVSSMLRLGPMMSLIVLFHPVPVSGHLALHIWLGSYLGNLILSQTCFPLPLFCSSLELFVPGRVDIGQSARSQDISKFGLGWE